MRRTLIAMALAWCVGLCTAAGVAYGSAMLDAWQGFGEQFQLGYVVGYLDAVALSRGHDRRTAIPTGGKADFERWRALVNDYFADPANAKRSVADGMAAAGKIIQDEKMKANAERRSQPTPVSSAAAPAATVAPTTAPH